MELTKFRAKVKGDAGLWKVWKIDWLNLLVELGGARSSVWTPMEKVTFMQFTGLLDKNEEEIFEGDIVRTENNCHGEVVWQEYGWFVDIKDERWDKLEAENLQFAVDMGIEVIGNIVQTPELLRV